MKEQIDIIEGGTGYEKVEIVDEASDIDFNKFKKTKVRVGFN